MLARSPCPPFKIVRLRSRYRRLVRCARFMRLNLGLPEWHVAQRLGMRRELVRLALKDGAGIWSPKEWARMRAAFDAEAGR